MVPMLRGMYQVSKRRSTTSREPPEFPQGGPKHGSRCCPRQCAGAGSQAPAQEATLTRLLLPHNFLESKNWSLPCNMQQSPRFGRDVCQISCGKMVQMVWGSYENFGDHLCTDLHHFKPHINHHFKP